MKIINNNAHKTIEFKDLVKGEVFKFDESYFLKTELMRKNGSPYANAVFLKTGDYMLFYEDNKILPINANFVIDED